jgi:hypothetical protein
MGTTGVAIRDHEPCTIRLVVIDEADVPIDLLTRAQAETTRIFEDIGLTVIWSDDSAAKNRFIVKVIWERLKGTRVDRRAIGAAPGTKSERGTIAYAFYRRVRDLALVSGGDVATILGHVIAHEVGHLLLPHGSHASDGLMRATWDEAHVQSARRGQLTFTPDQATAIRKRLAGRPLC